MTVLLAPACLSAQSPFCREDFMFHKSVDSSLVLEQGPLRSWTFESVFSRSSGSSLVTSTPSCLHAESLYPYDSAAAPQETRNHVWASTSMTRLQRQLARLLQEWVRAWASARGPHVISLGFPEFCFAYFRPWLCSKKWSMPDKWGCVESPWGISLGIKSTK